MPTTYSVKKGVEGEEDVIVKVGNEVEFKMSDVQKNMDLIFRKIKEFNAQIEFEQAKVENVKQNHPVVSTLEPVELTAIAVYAQAKGMLDQCVEKLKQAEDLVKEFTAEIEEINKQTGIEFVLQAPIEKA